MRLLGLVALLLLLQAGLAWAAPDEPELAPPPEPPITAYYNREFFHEPWRDSSNWKGIAADAGILAALDVAAYLVYRVRRRSA